MSADGMQNETETNGTTPPKLSPLELARLQLLKTQEQLAEVTEERDALRAHVAKAEVATAMTRLSEQVLTDRGMTEADPWRVNLQTGEFEPLQKEES